MPTIALRHSATQWRTYDQPPPDRQILGHQQTDMGQQLLTCRLNATPRGILSSHNLTANTDRLVAASIRSSSRHDQPHNTTPPKQQTLAHIVCWCIIMPVLPQQPRYVQLRAPSTHLGTVAYIHLRHDTSSGAGGSASGCVCADAHTHTRVGGAEARALACWVGTARLGFPACLLLKHGAAAMQACARATRACAAYGVDVRRTEDRPPKQQPLQLPVVVQVCFKYVCVCAVPAAVQSRVCVRVYVRDFNPQQALPAQHITPDTAAGEQYARASAKTWHACPLTSAAAAWGVCVP